MTSSSLLNSHKSENYFDQNLKITNRFNFHIQYHLWHFGTIREYRRLKQGCMVCPVAAQDYPVNVSQKFIKTAELLLLDENLPRETETALKNWRWLPTYQSDANLVLVGFWCLREENHSYLELLKLLTTLVLKELHFQPLAPSASNQQAVPLESNRTSRWNDMNCWI